MAESAPRPVSIETKIKETERKKMTNAVRISIDDANAGRWSRVGMDNNLSEETRNRLIVVGPVSMIFSSSRTHVFVKTYPASLTPSSISRSFAQRVKVSHQ